LKGGKSLSESDSNDIVPLRLAVIYVVDSLLCLDIVTDRPSCERAVWQVIKPMQRKNA